MTAETGRSDGPIDLADEADFQLGALLVSPSTREVGRGELRELLEPRVMQVLVALFRADGRVVSRDELITRCWEGRIVGEDAINRAIGRLRRLSEADGEASFGIETIPRVGYRLMAGPSAEAGPAPGLAAEPRKKAVRPVLIGAAAIAVVAAALFWLTPRPAPAPAPPAAARVAVLPFDALSDGPQARHFADALADEIVTRLNSNRIQVVSRDDAATLRGADRAGKLAELGVALLLDGTVEDDGKTVKVRVHLDDPVKHATLWSKSLDGPADKSDQLQAGVASTAVAVLACAGRALAPVHGLTDPDLLTHYLNACDFFVARGGAVAGFYEMLASLRDVANKAPDFTPAHSDLAKFDVYWAAFVPPDQAAPLRREAAAEAHKALAQDPKSPDAYLALATLLPPADWAGREKLLRQGLAGDPEWPFTNGVLGLTLADAGRLQEGIGYLQKAVAADLQIAWSTNSGRIQCAAGQFEPVTTDVTDAWKRNPNPVNGGSLYVLRRCLKYARRWTDLRALALTFSTPNERVDPRSSIYDVYLAAEESGKPADVAKARSAALAAADSGQMEAIASAVEVLSVLGFTDDAFAVAEHFKLRGVPADDTQFLFFTLTAPLRKDPRFMPLAARFGLVDYWKSSGHWPDFCADPKLPYNCQAEANRIMPAK